MGSGLGGRNQGFGKSGSVSWEDTGSCERCQLGGMLGHERGGEQMARRSLTCARALAGYRRGTGPLATIIRSVGRLSGDVEACRGCVPQRAW
jgi:hypothetical protein